jgi:hypothetical protein
MTGTITHKVRIRWGSGSFGDSQEPCEYEFSTIEELNAFLLGVDEASGCLDYHQIDPNPDGSWPEESGVAAQDEEVVG